MPSETVQRLRQQLREKFPAAHGPGSPPGAGPVGLPAASCPDGSPDLPTDSLPSSLDLRHFPQGAITEISPAHPACGLSLFFAALLAGDSSGRQPASPSSPLVLIDARDRFDPASFTPEACARLLWLRCRETRQALQAADLLLRDGNLPFVLLDLSALPARELRRIPTAAWHRLRQLAEGSACTLLALTPAPLVPRAALRLTLTREFSLQHLELSRDELFSSLQSTTTRRHARTA